MNISGYKRFLRYTSNQRWYEAATNSIHLHAFAQFHSRKKTVNFTFSKWMMWQTKTKRIFQLQRIFFFCRWFCVGKSVYWENDIPTEWEIWWKWLTVCSFSHVHRHQFHSFSLSTLTLFRLSLSLSVSLFFFQTNTHTHIHLLTHFWPIIMFLQCTLCECVRIEKLVFFSFCFSSDSVFWRRFIELAECVWNEV